MRTDQLNRNREQRTIYEVHRYADDGVLPIVEEYGGLDRARLAALGYALDGATTTTERLSGRVGVLRVFYSGGVRINETLVDILDERVAFRVLNELSLPHADALTVPIERLQAEANRLSALGI